MTYLTKPYLPGLFYPALKAKFFKDFVRPFGPKCKFGAMVSERIELMLMIFLPKTLVLFRDKMIVGTNLFSWFHID